MGSRNSLHRRRTLTALVAAAVVVLATVLPAQVAQAARVHPTASCGEPDHYSVTANHGSTFWQVGPTIEVQNDTPETDSFTVTSETTGSISLSVSGSGTYEGSIIIEGFKVSLGLTVTTTITVRVGFTGHVSVPGHSTRYARFGVFRQYVAGNYYHYSNNCTSSHTVATSYGPLSWGVKLTTT